MGTQWGLGRMDGHLEAAFLEYRFFAFFLKKKKQVSEARRVAT